VEAMAGGSSKGTAGCRGRRAQGVFKVASPAPTYPRVLGAEGPGVEAGRRPGGVGGGGKRAKAPLTPPRHACTPADPRPAASRPQPGAPTGAQPPSTRSRWRPRLPSPPSRQHEEQVEGSPPSHQHPHSCTPAPPASRSRPYQSTKANRRSRPKPGAGHRTEMPTIAACTQQWQRHPRRRQQQQQQQQRARGCKRPQQAATGCNRLQQAATGCNRLQQAAKATAACRSS
jgi:hypothetical protein